MGGGPGAGLGLKAVKLRFGLLIDSTSLPRASDNLPGHSTCDFFFFLFFLSFFFNVGYFSPSSFTGWADITELPEGLENYSLTRMEMKKGFHFADEPTKNLFKNLSHAFQARNRHRDRYMDYEEEVVIDGFEDHVIAYVDPLKKAWWIATKWYWIFSAILMSSILRWMIVKRTRRLSVKISKQVVVSF